MVENRTTVFLRTLEANPPGCPDRGIHKSSVGGSIQSSRSEAHPVAIPLVDHAPIPAMPTFRIHIGLLHGLRQPTDGLARTLHHGVVLQTPSYRRYKWRFVCSRFGLVVYAAKLRPRDRTLAIHVRVVDAKSVRMQIPAHQLLVVTPTAVFPWELEVLPIPACVAGVQVFAPQ